MPRGLRVLLLILSIIALSTPALADWERLPGQATDIAAAGRDEAYCIGSNRTDGGGFGIWRWDGGGWQALGGAGVRIAAGRRGVWVTNDQGRIWRWDGAWRAMPGQASDIGCGGGQVWAVGVSRESGGYGVWRWNRGDWERMPGAGVRIAVDDRGVAWLVNDRGDIFRWEGMGWRQLPGQAVDIGAGGGRVWIVSRRRAPGGFEVYQLTGGGWRPAGGAGVAIAVDDGGRPWLVNDRGDIFRWR